MDLTKIKESWIEIPEEDKEKILSSKNLSEEELQKVAGGLSNKAKNIIKGLAATGAFAGMAAGMYHLGNKKGYGEGHATGKQEGYGEGYKKGEQEGYHIGTQINYQKGMEDGAKLGYILGRKEAAEKSVPEELQWLMQLYAAVLQPPTQPTE